MGFKVTKELDKGSIRFENFEVNEPYSMNEDFEKSNLQIERIGNSVKLSFIQRHGKKQVSLQLDRKAAISLNTHLEEFIEMTENFSGNSSIGDVSDDQRQSWINKM